MTVNGEKLRPAALIAKVGEIAGLHGVGRIDLMEDRVVGIKSRETYECPASVALIAAHQEIERFTVMGDALRVKAQLDQRFAQLTYEGFWFSPLRIALEAFNDSLAQTVDGEVTLKLYKGSLRVVGRTSPHGLYNHALSTYGVEDRFDHRAAEGFIHLLGLQLQEFARQHGGIEE